MTGLLGVIGDPIAHSLSPLIHTGWLREAGIEASYEAMLVAEGGLIPALRDLAARHVIGVNITLPHKQAALAAASTVSETAQAIGAVNTLTLTPEHSWIGDNTDAAGFSSALSLAGVDDVSGKEILVLGAGGAARAIVHALHMQGANITILNRTEARAEALSAALTDKTSLYGQLQQLPEHISQCDIVINTTSLGHTGEHLALGDGKDRLFMDISYGRAAAAQLAHARKQGWHSVDGLTMLVAQAAESFHIWFGQRPDIGTALQVCRDNLEAAS